MTDNQKQIDQFRNLIKTTMPSDAIALRRELDRLVRSRKKMADAQMARRLNESGAENPWRRCQKAATP